MAANGMQIILVAENKMWFYYSAEDAVSHAALVLVTILV